MEAAFGLRQSFLRSLAARHASTLIINSFRAWGRESHRRLRWYRQLHGWLEHDHDVRAFFAGDTLQLPMPLRRVARERTAEFLPILPPELQRSLETGWPAPNDGGLRHAGVA